MRRLLWTMSRIMRSSTANRAKERIHHPKQPWQSTLSRSSSATSTYVPQTFQQQPAPAGQENTLTIVDTQMPVSQPIQTSQQSHVSPRGQLQPRGPQASFVVADDQQATGEESQHNISGLFSFFENVKSVISY